jgi:hypothetical protein
MDIKVTKLQYIKCTIFHSIALQSIIGILGMKIYHPATPSTTPPCQAKDQEISIFSGDIYTHTYHGHPGTILDREQNLISPFVIQ